MQHHCLLGGIILLIPYTKLLEDETPLGRTSEPRLYKTWGGVMRTEKLWLGKNYRRDLSINASPDGCTTHCTVPDVEKISSENRANAKGLSYCVLDCALVLVECMQFVLPSIPVQYHVYTGVYMPVSYTHLTLPTIYSV